MHERSLLRKLLLLLLLFAVMASTVYFFADRYYRDRNRQLYEPKLRWIDAMLSDEKQWIRQRQGESGELYVHESKNKDSQVTQEFDVETPNSTPKASLASLIAVTTNVPQPDAKVKQQFSDRDSNGVGVTMMCDR